MTAGCSSLSPWRGRATTGAAALLVLYAHDFQPYGPGREAAQVVVGGVWLVAGLIAWQRRPGNRVGPLMTAIGFLDVAPELFWNAALPFTLAELTYWFALPVFVHLFLAFPTGRLSTRFDRVFVGFTYAAIVLLSLLHAVRGPHTDWPDIPPDGPSNLLLVGHHPAVSRRWNIVHSCLLGVLPTLAVRLVRAYGGPGDRPAEPSRRSPVRSRNGRWSSRASSSTRPAWRRPGASAMVDRTSLRRDPRGLPGRPAPRALHRGAVADLVVALPARSPQPRSATRSPAPPRPVARARVLAARP